MVNLLVLVYILVWLICQILIQDTNSWLSMAVETMQFMIAHATSPLMMSVYLTWTQKLGNLSLYSGKCLFQDGATFFAPSTGIQKTISQVSWCLVALQTKHTATQQYTISKFLILNSISKKVDWIKNKTCLVIRTWM